MSDDSDRFEPPQPQPPNSKFKFKRRMPGWHPDTKNKVVLFPEEVLLKDKGQKFYAFQPPLKESQPVGWTLGTLLEDPPTTDFAEFLTEVAKRARIYNAALYWMRRLHFHENAKRVGKAPEFNERGDRADVLPDPVAQPDDFEYLVTQAEIEWEAAIAALNDILDGKPGSGCGDYKHTKADMIEANGYIVSMRVVSQKETWMKEIGGSESSHVHLSSPFSSSSSPNPPPTVVQASPRKKSKS